VNPVAAGTSSESHFFQRYRLIIERKFKENLLTQPIQICYYGIVIMVTIPYPATTIDLKNTSSAWSDYCDDGILPVDIVVRQSSSTLKKFNS
jgi:hypothetical protein